jgi:hypothetical protein
VSPEDRARVLKVLRLAVLDQRQWAEHAENDEATEGYLLPMVDDARATADACERVADELAAVGAAAGREVQEP